MENKRDLGYSSDWSDAIKASSKRVYIATSTWPIMVLPEKHILYGQIPCSSDLDVEVCTAVCSCV